MKIWYKTDDVCYLQEQRVDADDPRLWNRRQEVVFYSEGRGSQRLKI